MKCHVCGSGMTEVHTSLPFKITDQKIVILKNLPVYQCNHCSEYLLVDSVMARVDEILEQVDRDTELEVIQYAA